MGVTVVLALLLVVLAVVVGVVTGLLHRDDLQQTQRHHVDLFRRDLGVLEDERPHVVAVVVHLQETLHLPLGQVARVAQQADHDVVEEGEDLGLLVVGQLVILLQFLQGLHEGLPDLGVPVDGVGLVAIILHPLFI